MGRSSLELMSSVRATKEISINSKTMLSRLCKNKYCVDAIISPGRKCEHTSKDIGVDLKNIINSWDYLNHLPAVVYENDSAILFQEDSLKLMGEIVGSYPEGIFDMIFADPPYFLSNGGVTCKSGEMVSVNKGEWDVSRGVSENHRFNLTWLSYCQQLLKPDGTIWVSGTHHVIYSIGYAMQELGFKLLNDITWEKPAPPPNLSCRYFTHATETIIWAAKTEKSKHYFNYRLMKSINNNKQMKSVWRIGAPGVGEKKYGKHPTQKPVELLSRIILSSTKPDDLVFDPFSGSATTGVAAINTDRKFIGCELEEEYTRLSIARLAEAIYQKGNRLFQGDVI